MILQPFLDSLILMGLLLFSYGSIRAASYFNWELDVMSKSDKEDLGLWFYLLKALAWTMALGSAFLVGAACYKIIFNQNLI